MNNKCPICNKTKTYDEIWNNGIDTGLDCTLCEKHYESIKTEEFKNYI